MIPRLPLLVLALVVGGGVVAASAEGARPTLLSAPPPVPGVAGPVASARDALSSTWYCAGGTAADGGIADHRVVVVNPTGDEVAGRLTVHPGSLDGAEVAELPTARPFTVPAGERVTFRLADVLSAPLASAVVEVDQGGVVVEHQVVGPDGQDTAPCASAAAPEWHFAWGSTARDAREVLVLFNPFPSSVTVDTTFVTEAGTREPLRWQGLTVPAYGVVGMDAGQDVTRRDHVAATVRARGGGRLVVDRLQVFDGTAGRQGVDLLSGQPVGVEASVLAHGWVDDASGERVILYNPGSEAAEVEVAVRGTGIEPQPQPFGVVVRPGRFEVLDYGAETRVPRGVDHVTVIRSLNGVPVVAERVLERDGAVEAVPGAVFAATTWTVGATTRATTLVVANPDPDAPATLSITAAVGNRSSPAEWRDLQVPAGGQLTVPLRAATEGAGTLIVHATSPVVVEAIPAGPGTAPHAFPTIEGLTPVL